MIERHIYHSEFKLKYFGYGEWVEEPDEIEDCYNGIKFKVIRVVKKEPFADDCYFGGHLCGYVNVPKDHELYGKMNISEEINLDCHGGITFADSLVHGSPEFYIGFDCAHSHDLVPSMEKLRKQSDLISDLLPELKQFQHIDIFNPGYKNMDFCINECKSIVDQLLAIKEFKEI